MGNERLIQGLNQALNREVGTFLRYMLQASLIKGVEWAPLRDLYATEVGEEVLHAQYLADKIVMLGGRPELDPDLSPPPTDPREMLRHDIAEEYIDVEGYKKLAAAADELGLIELKMKMEEQAADEARHADALSRLLG